MPIEVKDVAGFSQPLTKLMEVVSSAIGTIYRPRSIRSDADAKAYEIKTIARAQAEAEVETHLIKVNAIEERIAAVARENPELAERARRRLLAREIEGQLNVEEIAEKAILALPQTVSPEPVSNDWRRKFFQEAENVCESDMQELWGKVLAGEIAQPGSYGLRTLETLKQLSMHEAELFRVICGVAMSDGWVIIPGFDVNTALKPYGVTFDTVLILRDAGLLMPADGISKTFPIPEQMGDAAKQRVMLINNGTFIELSGPSLSATTIPSLVFTQAGRELQKLIQPTPRDDYLIAVGVALRQRGLTVKRGSLVPQDALSSVLLFEQDL